MGLAAHAQAARWARLVCLVGAASFSEGGRAQGEGVEITFQSSFDGSDQLAFALVPEHPGPRPLPLLVLAHPAGGSRHSQDYYYPEIERRGWLLAVPELHGRQSAGGSSFGSLEAQHDILDVIDYMRSEYSVDPAPIYLAGRSMGGALAALKAAKHPGLFAAVVAGQGIHDFETWTTTPLPVELSEATMGLPSFVDSLVRAELGGPPSTATAYAYRRRSAVTYARNFRYVPLVLWHGTSDLLVPARQTELLVAAIREHVPSFPEPHWLRGAPHMPMNYPPSWILDQLELYRNVGWQYPGTTPGGTRSFVDLDFITDEAESFFWLGVTPVEGDVFAEAQASLREGALTVHTKDVETVSVHMEAIPDWIRFSSHDLQGGDGITLRIQREGEILFSREGAQTGALPDLWPSGP